MSKAEVPGPLKICSAWPLFMGDLWVRSWLLSWEGKGEDAAESDWRCGGNKAEQREKKDCGQRLRARAVRMLTGTQRC